jgi:hypothetical protein
MENNTTFEQVLKQMGEINQILYGVNPYAKDAYEDHDHKETCDCNA